MLRCPDTPPPPCCFTETGPSRVSKPPVAPSLQTNHIGQSDTHPIMHQSCSHRVEVRRVPLFRSVNMSGPQSYHVALTKHHPVTPTWVQIRQILEGHIPHVTSTVKRRLQNQHAPVLKDPPKIRPDSLVPKQSLNRPFWSAWPTKPPPNGVPFFMPNVFPTPSPWPIKRPAGLVQSPDTLNHLHLHPLPLLLLLTRVSNRPTMSSNLCTYPVRIWPISKQTHVFSPHLT